MDGQRQQNAGQSAEKGLDGFGLIGVDVSQAEAATFVGFGMSASDLSQKTCEQSRENENLLLNSIHLSQLY